MKVTNAYAHQSACIEEEKIDFTKASSEGALAGVSASAGLLRRRGMGAGSDTFRDAFLRFVFDVDF